MIRRINKAPSLRSASSSTGVVGRPKVAHIESPLRISNFASLHHALGCYDGLYQLRMASSSPIPIKINQNIVSLGEKSDWDGILNEFAVNRPYFNDINYATALSRLGKLSPQSDDTRLRQLFADVAEDLTDLVGIQRMGIQGLSNILHGLVKLQEYDTLRTICATLEENATVAYVVKNGSPQAIATILWACAKARMEVPVLCELICRDADRLADAAKSRDIANIVWALARLGVTDTTWFSTTLENQVSKLVTAKNIQDVINCVWACSTAGSSKCPRLFALVEQQAPRFVRNPQDISNAVWAFATLEIPSNRLFQVLDKNAKTIVRDGFTQAVSNCAWACGVMDFEAPLLFREIDANATRLASNANATEIASIVTSAVKLKHRLPGFFGALELNAERILMDQVGNPQALSNILWAAAKQGVVLPNLIHLTLHEQQVDHILKDGSAQEITIIAWAIVELDAVKFKRSLFCRELARHAHKIRSSGDVIAISTLDQVLSRVHH